MKLKLFILLLVLGLVIEFLSPSLVSVVRVIDGDTFVARNIISGGVSTVRLARINAPEMGVYDGLDARCQLAYLLSKQEPLLLIKDPAQFSRDVYGRKIRFVYQSAFINVGDIMLAKGYAVADGRRRND